MCGALSPAKPGLGLTEARPLSTFHVGGRGRNRTLSDAVLETAALPVSYMPDFWHRLPVTIQRLCGHNAALCH